MRNGDSDLDDVEIEEHLRAFLRRHGRSDSGDLLQLAERCNEVKVAGDAPADLADFWWPLTGTQVLLVALGALVAGAIFLFAPPGFLL